MSIQPLLVKALIRAGDHIRRHFRGVVKDYGLNFLQASVLRHLDEPQPMGSIAERMDIDASYVTALVDRLEALGYVERQPALADRRVKNVALTPSGIELRHAIRTSFIEIASPFEHLTEAEQSQLLELLTKAFPSGTDEVASDRGVAAS